MMLQTLQPIKEGERYLDTVSGSSHTSSINYIKPGHGQIQEDVTASEASIGTQNLALVEPQPMPLSNRHEVAAPNVINGTDCREDEQPDHSTIVQSDNSGK
eukprot:g45033.t1